MSSVYPFKAQLTAADGVPSLVHIVKITSAGFLAQVTGPLKWKTGDRLQVQFNLPLSDSVFNEPVKVIKSYLKWGKTPAGTVAGEKNKVQIFEMHFLSLASQKKSVIDQLVAMTSPGDQDT